MTTINRVFLKGLLAVLPILLTGYLVVWLAKTSEALFKPLFTWFLPDHMYLPGMGVALGVVAIFAIGLMLQAWFIRKLWDWGEALLSQMPVIRQIYEAIKQTVDFLNGDEGPKGSTVTVRIGDPPVRLLGLVTRDEVDFIAGTDEQELVAVFLPWSYQVGGLTVLVPRSSIEQVSLEREELLRLAFTAGVSTRAKSKRKDRPG